MEEWHKKKWYKYEGLLSSVSLNGWEAHLFPIGVGSRGYCATTVKSCLMRLGFSGKTLRTTLKSLSMSSLKASFQIWLSRDTRDWSNINKTSLFQTHSERESSVSRTSLKSEIPSTSLKTRKDKLLRQWATRRSGGSRSWSDSSSLFALFRRTV